MAESKNDGLSGSVPMEMTPKVTRKAESPRTQVKYMAKSGNIMVAFPNRAVTFNSIAGVALTTEELESSAFKKYEDRLRKIEVPVEV